jgi:hypothetical protein
MGPGPGVTPAPGVAELPGVIEIIELPSVVAAVPAVMEFPGVVPADAAPTPVKTAMATVATMSSVANKVRNTIILSELGPLTKKAHRQRGRSASDHGRPYPSDAQREPRVGGRHLPAKTTRPIKRAAASAGLSAPGS